MLDSARPAVAVVGVVAITHLVYNLDLGWHRRPSLFVDAFRHAKMLFVYSGIRAVFCKLCVPKCAICPAERSPRWTACNYSAEEILPRHLRGPRANPDLFPKWEE